MGGFSWAVNRMRSGAESAQAHMETFTEVYSAANLRFERKIGCSPSHDYGVSFGAVISSLALAFLPKLHFVQLPQLIDAVWRHGTRGTAVGFPSLAFKIASNPHMHHTIKTVVLSVADDLHFLCAVPAMACYVTWACKRTLSSHPSSKKKKLARGDTLTSKVKCPPQVVRMFCLCMNKCADICSMLTYARPTGTVLGGHTWHSWQLKARAFPLGCKD